MHIGITFNLKSDYPTSGKKIIPDDAQEEFDLPETVAAITKILTDEGHQIFPLGGDLEIVDKIGKWGIEFVFNIAEGLNGRSREAQIPSVLEMLGIPYSGSDPLGLAVTLDKSVMKRIAISMGIPTPEYWTVENREDIEQIPDRFPLFVKPIWEGSSKGIRRSSCVQDRRQLETEVNRILDNYSDEPVLVEKCIPGREITVGVVGNKRPEILGVMEIAFRDPKEKDFCYSLEVKRNWKEEVEYHWPAKLNPRIEEGICNSSQRLFETLRLRDIARFDFRVNERGEFYLLEINPLPGLSPESGDLVILCKKKGWSYKDLILRITQEAFSRYPEFVSHSQR